MIVLFKLLSLDFLFYMPKICYNECINEKYKNVRKCYIMIEYEELFKNFSKLGLDEKRNKYNEEIIKIALLLKSFLNERNLELIDMPYNYKSGEDKKMSESDLLNINFRDLYIIKAELLMLINCINEDRKQVL